jgi:hypothetical protein
LAKHMLICHADTPAPTVDAFEVHAERQADGIIWIRYHVDALIDSLELGEPTEAIRTDGLWKTTCFELFVRKSDQLGYCEYNFAPSSKWAAYRFDSYREGMIDLSLDTAPDLGNDASETHFALEAIVALPQDFCDADLEIAVTAVIEETGGTISYWALNHPAGKPDFHHPDCFALTLPAPASA